MENVQSIQIIGKRWFDRVNGNTYFSSVGIVDGKPVVFIDFEYGYGDQYEYRTAQELSKAGYLPEDHLPLSLYCRENGIEYYRDVTDVQRKKDL